MRKFIFGFITGFWAALAVAELTGVNDKLRDA